MIGVDISDGSIKIVQISHGKKRRLLTYCTLSLPDGVMMNGVVKDQERMQGLLREAMTACRLPIRKGNSRGGGRVVVASIPETQSFLRVVEIPEMREDEIGEAVRWEIAQHIPFSLDKVYGDWQPLFGDMLVSKNGKQEVQVGAAQRLVVDSLHETFRGLGLDVAAFELESQAIVRALVSKSLREKEGLLIVDLGGTATNVVVHDRGAMRFTASLQKGIQHVASSLTPDDAKVATVDMHALDPKIVERLKPLMMPAMMELVKEVRGIVDFYNGTDAKHGVREIVVTGGGSNVPGLDEAFFQHFSNVHVQRGNPWVNILSGTRLTHPPMDIRESARFSTALGLALRNVSI